MKLNISKLINSNLAVTSENADIVFKAISDSMKNKEKVIIDFSGIKTLTTAFLNIAIGKLYAVATSEELNRYISFDVSTLTDFQKSKIRLVQQNAKVKLLGLSLESD